MRYWRAIAPLAAAITLGGCELLGGHLTATEIAQKLVEQSVASYVGACPCPYGTDSHGASCASHNAYSSDPEAAVLCYVGDVTQDMITAYIVAHT